jgi:hypothetical protein
MKVIPIIASCLMLLASCKKDRTCTCTEPGDVDTYTIVESRKAQAKANCMTTRQTINGVDYVRECKLD